MSKKLTHADFLERTKSREDWQEYEWLSEYIGSANKIKYKHICGYEHEIMPHSFLAGVGCSNPECIQSRTKQTNLERYGVERPSQCERIKEKTKQTNVERYGVETIFQVPEFREKARRTNLERYGVESPLQCEMIKEKAKQTNLERYGVENPMQLEGIKEKIKQTNLERYGVKWNSQSEKTKEKKRQTFLKKYGVEHQMQSKEIKEKMAFTQLTNFHGEEQAQILSNPNLLKELLQLRLFTVAELTKYFGYKDPTSVYDLLHKYDLYDLVDHKPEISSFHSDFLHHIPTDDVNNRTVLDGLEIDCYYSDQKIGIELNGIYWHSEQSPSFKDHKYHNRKTELAAEKGIRLIHIFEHQWYNEKDKWINYILNALGYNEERIYARETHVAEVSTADYRNLLNTHHLQSYAPASIKLGLYSKKTNELVFVMGFKKNKNTDHYTLERMCSSIHTIGGATKCLSYFIKTYNPSLIETFCDTTTFTGSVYEKMGFEKVATVQPMYSWVNNKFEVIKRRSAQKANIIKKFNLPPETMDKTENEIMTELGYYKIWGCNLIKYQWRKGD